MEGIEVLAHARIGRRVLCIYLCNKYIWRRKKSWSRGGSKGLAIGKPFICLFFFPWLMAFFDNNIG